MLADKDSSAIVPVTDFAEAKRFYGETLGLDRGEEMDGIATYRTGGTTLVLYESENAGTNRGNAVVWGVGEELDAIVVELKSKGVEFLEYDFPDTTFHDGVHESHGTKMAWFKDPSGNILHINSM